MQEVSELAAPRPARPIVLTTHVDNPGPGAAARIAADFAGTRLAMVFFFASPEADFAALAADMHAAFPDCDSVGCTTAGELTGAGYSEGTIVAIGLASADFAASPILIDDLDGIGETGFWADILRRRIELAARFPALRHEFGFLAVDGLSLREDELTAMLATCLGPGLPIFGGSAGDGARFKRTWVACNGRVRGRAAVFSLVRTDCPVKVFSLDNLKPTERRMVVTEADPANRIVRRINAAPAAREYARLLGKDPSQLTTFTFAAHPVVVRIGARHHVRAIQQVAENGDLIFFSAIDEGLVLTLAEPEPIIGHLDAALADLAQPVAPVAILACDCILRRLEVERTQQSQAVSQLLRRHRVAGFSTYGEQVNGIHVNQTMTGVAFYPPGSGRDRNR